MSARRTTCPYCGVGCGVMAEITPDGSVAIQGDQDHPANQGRLCVKGAALGETLDLVGRMLWPIIDGKRVSWQHNCNRLSINMVPMPLPSMVPASC